MNDANGLHIFDGVVDAQRGEAVFQHFVLPVAKTSLFRGHFRQRFGVVRCFLGHVFHDGVDLLLRKGGQHRLRLFGVAHQFPRVLPGLQIVIQFNHESILHQTKRVGTGRALSGHALCCAAIFSMSLCGRAMTRELTTSPMRFAASTPESTAALTAPTSPFTIAVTRPEPTFS